MNGSVRSSAALVWRHQRFVWWILLANLVLAFLGSLPARVSFGSVLNHSLMASRFVSGFDFAALFVMLSRQDVPLAPLAVSAIASALVFYLYLLLIDGGVFAVYLDDRKLSRAEFFENAGLFFWRMLRLSLYSLIPFALVAAITGGIATALGKLADNAAPDKLGFFVTLGGKLVFILIFLFVRLWFDLTQARIVKDNERHVLRTTWRSLKLAFRCGKLYASYLGIALFYLVALCLGGALWFFLPHSATFASFIVLEIVTAIMIATRLWMKAASARYVALLPYETPMQIAPPIEPGAPSAEVVEVTDIPTPPPAPE